MKRIKKQKECVNGQNNTKLDLEFHLLQELMWIDRYFYKGKNIMHNNANQFNRSEDKNVNEIKKDSGVNKKDFMEIV